MKASLTDVSVQFLGGMFSIEVDLMPVASKKKAVELKQICPDCPTETAPEQFYQCDKKHGPYKSGQLDRAMPVGKALRRVTPDQIAAMKEPELPVKVLDVHWSPAHEFDSVAQQKGDRWIAKPRKNPGMIALVAELVADPTKAFYGELNFGGRQGQKFVRLTARRPGVLEIMELARPEEIHPVQPVTDGFDTTMLFKVQKLNDTLGEPFDPTKFASEVRKRAQELATTLNGGTAPAVTTKVKPSTDIDLMAALDAALASVQP